MAVPIEDPFFCPACLRSVPGAEACRHLRDHEESLSRSTMTEDTLGADVSRQTLVLAVRAHSKMRWLGQCICAEEKPGPGNELPKPSK